jgi:hypothetical protein
MVKTRSNARPATRSSGPAHPVPSAKKKSVQRLHADLAAGTEKKDNKKTP